MNFNQFHKLIWKGSFNLFFFQLTVVPQVMAIIVVRSKRKFQIQSLGFALLSQSISSPHAFPQSEWFTNFPQSEFWHVSLSHPEFHAQPLDFLMECFVLVQNRNQESGSNFSHKTNLGMPHYFTSNFLPSHSIFAPRSTVTVFVDQNRKSRVVQTFPQSEFWHVSLAHPEFPAQPLGFLMECFVGLVVQNRNREWFTTFPQSEFWHVSLSHHEFPTQPLGFLMECFDGLVVKKLKSREWFKLFPQSEFWDASLFHLEFPAQSLVFWFRVYHWTKSKIESGSQSQVPKSMSLSEPFRPGVWSWGSGLPWGEAFWGSGDMARIDQRALP